MDVRLETNRLVLREYKPRDLPSIDQYASQPSAVQYQNWGPNTLLETKQYLQQTQHNRFLIPRMMYELCIERKADDVQIGGCTLAINSKDDSIATLAYTLNPRFWNQGYATETSKELIRFGFTQLNLRLVQATCDRQNQASRRVLEKSGFLLEAILENDFMQKGKMRTTLVFTYQPVDQSITFYR
jgi:RimJ/RimL family protein N-acetyltransferase